MTFRELMGKFERRPLIYKSAGSGGLHCTMTAIVPYENVTSVAGCRILGVATGAAAFEFPVDEGTARLVGTIQLEEDGTQSLKRVCAVLSERDGKAD